MKLCATLIIFGFLALCSPPAPAAEESAEAAQAVFKAAFAADLARAKASRDPKDVLDFATRLLETAKETQGQAAFVSVLCEKAYEIALPLPACQDVAVEAMDLLASRVPAKAISAADAAAEVRQRQFAAARGADRPKAGEAVIDAFLKAADLRFDAGAATEALPVYRKAAAIAGSIKSDRRPAIEAKIKDMVMSTKANVELATLKSRVESNPEDAEARDRLVRLYLVSLDDPATAATYVTGAKDRDLCKFVPAVARGADAAPELACTEIAAWYGGLADTAPPGCKAALLARAKTYYVRFLELHLTDDLERVKASVALKKLETDLAGVASPTQVPTTAVHPAASRAKWIDMLATVDLTKDVVCGQWTREGAGVSGAGSLGDKAPVLLVLQTAIHGDYELEIKFTRKSGDGRIAIILPVDSSMVAVSLSWEHGEASGLDMISGHGPRDNPSAVKPGTLVNNHEYTALCKVTVDHGNASVTVTLDGKPYITWQGPESALSLYQNLRLSRQGFPGLGAEWSPVTFGSAKVRMLSGENKSARQESPRVSSSR